MAHPQRAKLDAAAVKRLAMLAVVLTTALTGCYELGGDAPPPPVVSERAFLVGHEPEAQGYGAYSYLLLASPPTSASRDRYLAVITAYLDFIPRRAEDADYIPESQLNLTYALLTESAPPAVLDMRAGGQSEGDQQAAQWVLDHYNYARAQAILHILPGAHADGPYIVTALLPLTDRAALSGAFMEQDLTHIPPEFAVTWVKIFIGRAAQAGWPADRLQTATVNLRQALAVAADEWPAVQKSLPKWVKWSG